MSHFIDRGCQRFPLKKKKILYIISTISHL